MIFVCNVLSIYSWIVLLQINLRILSSSLYLLDYRQTNQR